MPLVPFVTMLCYCRVVGLALLSPISVLIPLSLVVTRRRLGAFVGPVSVTVRLPVNP